MRLCTYALLLSLLATACTLDGDPADDVGAIDQGITELRIDARALLDAGITQVTLQAGGLSQDLVQNPATGTYDGTLLLPSGPQSLVARAYAGTTLVGASNPTAVNVLPNQVTRIVMRILDLTSAAPPLYGPILDSLVFPATAQATAPVSFTASVLAPAGDPVTYAWSSTCADAMFSAPAAAATSWSKPTQGSCSVTMLATSNGFSISQSFSIVVFPAGSANGAIDASADFITAPSLSFALPGAGCFLFPGGNASCSATLASPNMTSYDVSVMGWGKSTPGSLTVSDNCGGQFGMSNTSPEYRTGAWLPPTTAGVCILTATAVNGDGLASTLSAAILVRTGTAGTAQPPSIYAQIYPGLNCYLSSSSPGPTPLDCGTVPAGSQLGLFGNLSWADGTPGSVTLIDTCNGGLTQPNNAYNFNSYWNLPSLSGQTCTLTVRATNLQGGVSEAAALYHLQ
ncbi:MAG TPA: hypothetical protein VNO30_13825 [Kofleriaceae bacterium]|nr:hypothetical protein [Kofleriaceae bacterium]